MRSYRYLHLDVFTDRLFGGNQLAVFLDARGLDAATMQAIAKEMNFSETTFVLPAEDERPDVRVRIFTPADELPMAGHPTIGTAFALAHVGVFERGRAHVRFGLGVGPADVEHQRLQHAYGLGRDVCVYLFTTERGHDEGTAYSRMFGPSIGIGEDPATGSACGPLGCYLLHHHVVTASEARRMLSRPGCHNGAAE